MKEFIEKLQNIGLTQNEAKVYLFLLEYQEARTGIICSKLGIHNSHIYKILERLLDKGIISYKIVNNVKVFRPVDPESLFALFKEKERVLIEQKQDLKIFISKLKKIEIKEQKENDFKYFEGQSGVRSMFTEFVSSFDKSSDVLIASAPLSYEKWNAFLLDLFHPPRIKKKVSQKLLIPRRLKKHALEREKFKPIEIKYTSTEMDSEFGVSGDLIYFLSKGDKPYALLIRDKNLANTHRMIFDTMWKNAKEK
jgi:HTH-type transcriptional regulator, sugar sensing transcriptional regulator